VVCVTAVVVGDTRGVTFCRLVVGGERNGWAQELVVKKQ